jgi:hypothetical protein
MWRARSTPEIQIFWPVTTKSSPSRRAWVLMLIALLPASGSVMAKQVSDSPAARAGSSARFCSSVPWRAIVSAPKAGVSR